MATTFQRLNARPSSLEPRQYTVMTETHRPAVCCPACACVYDLPSGIDCDVSGRTNYTLQCPQDSCGWLDYAVLDSFWEE